MIPVTATVVAHGRSLGRVDAVEPSPHRPEKAYVAVLRYQLGDWEPYVYRTNDYGATWTRLTTGKNGVPADSPGGLPVGLAGDARREYFGESGPD